MELIANHIDCEDEQQHVHRIQHVARLRREQREPLLPRVIMRARIAANAAITRSTSACEVRQLLTLTRMQRLPRQVHAAKEGLAGGDDLRDHPVVCHRDRPVGSRNRTRP